MRQRIRQTKPFAPKEGAIGSEVIWTHFRASGEAEVRTGIVVGQAPACGPGHKSELWVVPDTGRERDLYPGGVVVAERAASAKYGGYGIPSWQEVAIGELFSDDRLNAATGSLAVSNWRQSAASTYQSEAA